MATIFKTRQGHWRAQVRRKGKYVSSTFKLKTLAQEWVTETERLIDQGSEPLARGLRRTKTVGDLVDLIPHMLEAFIKTDRGFRKKNNTPVSNTTTDIQINHSSGGK